MGGDSLRFVPTLTTAMLFFSLAALVSTPSAAGSRVRWDETGPFFWGNLTWEGDRGRIVWGPAPPGVDDLPASDPTDGNQARFQYAQTWTGLPVGAAPPAAEEFVGDPLPRALYLNATRNLQIELMLKKDPANADPPCQWRYDTSLGLAGGLLGGDYEPNLEVTLTLDGRRLGGTGAGDYVDWSSVGPDKTAPTPPAGYGPCRFGVHPEASVLPEGAVLRLRVDHHAQIYDYPYGFQGDHRSTIRIPLYPPEEVPFRYADLLEEEFVGADTAGLAPLAFAAALSAFRGRRPSTAAAVALLLAIGLLSGCVAGREETKEEAGGDKRLQGQAENTLVIDKEGDLTKAGSGTILGQVNDDLHIPVPAVHVSVLGSGEFTKSNAKGRFQFADLAAGTYRLRFDHAEYRSFETDVEVKAGFVSRPSVTLYLLSLKTRDFRPHVHDYWDGQATKDLGTFQLEPVCYPGPPESCSYPYQFRIPAKPGEVTSILPGTREVELTFTFDAGDVAGGRLGLALRHNTDPPPPYMDYSANWSVFGARPSGQAFRIATSWEMADPGHQPFSTWIFQTTPAPGPAKGFVPAMGGAYLKAPQALDPLGPITVHAVAHKGTIPLEPPHTDYWKDTDRIQTVKNAKGYYFTSTVPPGTPDTYCWTDQGLGGNIQTCYYENPMRATPSKVTPTGTQWIEFTLSLSRPTVPAFGWQLLYEPANIPWYMVNPSTGEGYKAATLHSHDDKQYKWRIPVREGETDPEYSKVTGWDFLVKDTDGTSRWADYVTNAEVLAYPFPTPHITITFNAVAYNTPMPS